MAKSYSLSGSFNPGELAMLVGVYQDVCRGLEEKGLIVPTARVREAIAIMVFNMATSGERDPHRLRRRAMQEVEAYGGVQRTLDRSSGKRPTRRPPAPALDHLLPPVRVGEVPSHPRHYRQLGSSPVATPLDDRHHDSVRGNRPIHVAQDADEQPR
jgi:hypothetical protein